MKHTIGYSDWQGQVDLQNLYRGPMGLNYKIPIQTPTALSASQV